MRVYAGDVSFLEGRRERLQPSLRLPFVRIFTPKLLVAVARLNVRDNSHAVLNRNVVNERPIASTNGRRERQDAVLPNTIILAW